VRNPPQSLDRPRRKGVPNVYAHHLQAKGRSFSALFFFFYPLPGERSLFSVRILKLRTLGSRPFFLYWFLWFLL